MARRICPQVAGIYHNNEAPTDATYGYLWIAEHHPNCEYWAIDAFECKRDGEINPSKTTSEPHVSSDFGNVVQF
jgi:hypothetical protein